MAACPVVKMKLLDTAKSIVIEAADVSVVTCPRCAAVNVCAVSVLAVSASKAWIVVPIADVISVSYTHLTLPTNREV